MSRSQDDTQDPAHVFRTGREPDDGPPDVDSRSIQVHTAIPAPETPGQDSVDDLIGWKPRPGVEMDETDRRWLERLNREVPIIRSRVPSALAAEPCANHEAIGTVFDIRGPNLAVTDTVGTWVSMAIFPGGIPGLSGFFYTPMSTVASQTIEILGFYRDAYAGLAVFDWSCVEGKPGVPFCGADPWVYAKPLEKIRNRYKYWYWDGCRWQQALALANYSRFLYFLEIDVPWSSEALLVPVYANQALWLNWDALEWEVFYRRLFLARDAQAWVGPRAFLEFITDACPSVPRAGFQEIRARWPGEPWQLAVPDNSHMRFDLADRYRYGLLDPNHTWAVVDR